MKYRWLYILPILTLSILSTGAIPEGTVETIGPCTLAEVSEAMRSALAPQGLRVNGTSGVLCEIWLRKVIPQKAGSTGSAYNTLANGTFAGVISYPAKAGDYRGQAVKVGVYTLRYQTIPQDGNHLGISPTPDFFLLCPSSADQNPDAVIEYAELVKLSKQASGTNHPNPLYLALPVADGEPSFKSTDEGHSALETKTKAQPAGGGAEINFPLALILVGKAEG